MTYHEIKGTERRRGHKVRVALTLSSDQWGKHVHRMLRGSCKSVLILQRDGAAPSSPVQNAYSCVGFWVERTLMDNRTGGIWLTGAWDSASPRLREELSLDKAW